MKNKSESANASRDARVDITDQVTAEMATGLQGYTSDKLASERLGQPDVQQKSVTEALINNAAIYLYRQAKWQPIAQLDAQSLTSQFSEWNIGTMRRFSLTMDAVESRDPVVKAATGKLKMSLARRGYEIVKVEGADEDEADAHADALRYFYTNCTATSAVDRNIRGGFSRLVQFIMDAALKRYSPFEIVWRPDGEQLTATFVHVPLWFFENRTGSLRFCGNFAWDGVPLKDGRWMVACGEGIMESIVAMWMYKTYALRDWLIYSQRAGMPVPAVTTAHAAGSAGYKAIHESLSMIGSGADGIIMGLQDKLDKLDFGTAGQLPYPLLVDYVDKTICALARGADLGTLSADGGGGEGQGASLQGDESDLVEQHYGQMVSETLNHYVDPWIIRWHFGDDAVPLAYCKLDVPKKQDLALQLQVDEKLVEWGCELGIENALERYGRVEAGPGDKLLESQMDRMQEMQEAQGGEQGQFLGNARILSPENSMRVSRLFMRQAAKRLCRTSSARLSPLKRKIANLLEMKNDRDFVACLRDMKFDCLKFTSEADHKTRKEINGVLAMNRL